MKNSIVLSLFLGINFCAYASELTSVLQKYHLTLSTSSYIQQCFAQTTTREIFTKKHVLFHLVAQAAKNKHFSADKFDPLLKDFPHQQGPYVIVKQVDIFYNLLAYIPWNGNIKQEDGFIFHEVLLNDKPIKLSIDNLSKNFGSAPLITSVFVNDTDDAKIKLSEKIDIPFE